MPADSSNWRLVPESLGDEYEILEDDRCIDTGVFQQRYFLHELVFACSDPPRARLQISCTILTQAGWCAARTVARWVSSQLSILWKRRVRDLVTSVVRLSGNLLRRVV